MRTFIVPLSLAALAAACSSYVDQRDGNEPASSQAQALTAPVVTKPVNGADFFHGYKIDVPPAQSAVESVNTFDARAKEMLRNEACDATGEFRNNAPLGEHWSKDLLAMVAYTGDCPKGLPIPPFCSPSAGATETAADRARCATAALGGFSTGDKLLGTEMDGSVMGVVRHGDLDMVLKDLIPILVRYSSSITPGAYDHMLTYLQQVDSGGYVAPADGSTPVAGDFSQIKLTFDQYTAYAAALGFLAAIPAATVAAATFDYASVPETENHMHMIHSIRYVVNDLLYDAGKGEQYNNRTNGMTNYWLNRLASILRHDFQEYNSKPYNRMSLDAIQNLAEFARSPEVQTAAREVLDFAAAKFAVSSSLLRRQSAFRRRAEYYKGDFWGGAVASSDPKAGPNYGVMDEEACRFALYAGTTDLFPFVNGQYLVPDPCVYDARLAMGSYRVPSAIVELALNKAQNPTFQTFAGGWNDIGGAPGNLEIYDNEGPFLIAGGGVANASGNDLVLHLKLGLPSITIKNPQANDQGVAVPAVILPNRTYPGIPNATTGVSADDPRNFADVAAGVSILSGLCVAPGFACGLDMAFTGDANQTKTWKFADYGTFYVVGFRMPVIVMGLKDAHGNVPTKVRTVGFVEAIPATRFAGLAALQTAVYAANGEDGSATITRNGGDDPILFSPGFDVHYTSALGGTITAHVDALSPRSYPVTQDRGLSLPAANTDTWPLASGLISAQHDGTVSVTTPSFKTSYSAAPVCQLIDSDHGSDGVYANPRRVGCDEMPPGWSPPPPPPTSSISWTHVVVPPLNRPYVFPPNAIVVGGVGTLDEYVCRVMTGTVPSLGHFDNRGSCYTILPNGSLIGSKAFDVMVFTPDGADDAYNWVYSQAGQTAPNQYVAGLDANGGPVGVCRVETPTGHLYPGMLVNSGCVILDDGALAPTTYSTYSAMTLAKVSTTPVGGCTPVTHCAGSCGQLPNGCGGVLDCGTCCPTGQYPDPSTGRCVPLKCDPVACDTNCYECNGSRGTCSSAGICGCSSKKYCQ